MKSFKINILLFLTILSVQVIYAQNPDSTKSNEPFNAVSTIIEKPHENPLVIGAYGQLDFNQQFGDTARHNGILDVHRMVIFMGYKFNNRTHFVTEFEFEHVNEVLVEQAFLNYKLARWVDIRAGLMLIPMGIINEYHEPTTFNGSLRPNLDNKIVPSTWREIGAGFTGKIDNASLKYQLYVMNGFNGYDTGGKFKGDDGLRGGRQKGIKSYMTSPDISAKLDYFGVKGLKLGAAIYSGASESKLFEGLWKEDTLQNKQAKADSSVVEIMMMGFDARYEWKGIEARAQYIIANLSNTEEYNKLTGKDLGSSMSGYYFEAGYNVLRLCKKTENKLIIFARYENYNTHASVESGTAKNDAYNRTDITAGIGFKVANGAVFKADYQNMSNAKSGSTPKNMFNMGVGIWF
ncbi:MAG: hypothetical protein EPN85_00585 [Bacteroidetes bacterium]|nr:MAG: hypothetical protein EPN85_00585 [Bacteroidota bacterium]